MNRLRFLKTGKPWLQRAEVLEAAEVLGLTRAMMGRLLARGAVEPMVFPGSKRRFFSRSALAGRLFPPGVPDEEHVTWLRYGDAERLTWSWGCAATAWENAVAAGQVVRHFLGPTKWAVYSLADVHRLREGGLLPAARRLSNGEDDYDDDEI